METANVSTQELSDTQAHKLFWESINDKCQRCLNACKQSFKVTILSCDFKKS